MIALWKLSIIQIKIYLRDPLSLFFTLLFAPLLLVMIGFVFGNEPDPMIGDMGFIDYAIASYAGIIIGIVGLAGVPISTATRRESGVLRRFSVTPLKPLIYFLSDIVAPIFGTLLGILLLFAVGRLAYDIRFEGNFFSFVAAIFISAISLFSVGYAVGGLATSARSATVIGNIVLIPTLFFSGAYMPMQMMPEGVQRAAQFLPLIHVVNLLRGLWFGGAMTDYVLELLVLVGILATSAIVVVLTFRWE
jgi:ABC-2 type transport system permease protein